MRLLYFSVLFPFSSGGANENISTIKIIGTTEKAYETGSTGLYTLCVSPTNLPLRLTLPIWENGTNSTRNISQPIETHIPSSAGWNPRDYTNIMLLLKALFLFIISSVVAVLY